jgi:hypothetical protein
MGGSRLGLGLGLGLGLAAVALAAMGFSLSNILRILDKLVFVLIIPMFSYVFLCFPIFAYAGAELR